MSQSTNYTYQLNAYFGIFYPDDLIATVLDLCKTDARFSALGGDDAEVTINKTLLFASTNSDIDGECAIGFIAVDEMTFEGPDMEDSKDVSIPLEPSEMEKRETKYRSGVEAITDLYDLLVKEFKRRKLPTNKLQHGWRVISCTWDLDSSTSGTSSEDKKQPAKPAKTLAPKKPTQRPDPAPIEPKQSPPAGRGRREAKK